MNLLEPREGDDVEINLVSLVDVVFTLLLFFVVTATFEHFGELTLKLPEAGAGVTTEKTEGVDIVVDASGRYFVNGDALVNTQLGTLMEAIKSAASGKDHPAIVISADAHAEHQSVVTAMDASRQLGFTRLTIATEVKRDEGSPSRSGDGQDP